MPNDNDAKQLRFKQPFCHACNVRHRGGFDVFVAAINVIDTKIVQLDGNEDASDPVRTIQREREGTRKIGFRVPKLLFGNAFFRQAFPFGPNELQDSPTRSFRVATWPTNKPAWSRG